MTTTFKKRQKEMKRMEKARMKAERRAQTDLAGEEPGAGAGVRHQPAVHEVPREPGTRAGHSHVALGRELGAHADGRAVDGRYHRFGAALDSPSVLIVCVAARA